MKRDEKQKTLDRLEAIQSLQACREADALFHANEDEKNFRKFEEKKELKGFHSKQIVSSSCIQLGQCLVRGVALEPFKLLASSLKYPLHTNMIERYQRVTHSPDKLLTFDLVHNYAV